MDLNEELGGEGFRGKMTLPREGLRAEVFGGEGSGGEGLVGEELGIEGLVLA